MKQKTNMFSPKTITYKFLLAFLYLAALYLSIQIPADFIKYDRDGQSLFEQQSICLVPIELRGNRLLNSPVNLVTVHILPFSGFLESYRLRANLTFTPFKGYSSTVFLPFREIVITMRRLRI